MKSILVLIVMLPWAGVTSALAQTQDQIQELEQPANYRSGTKCPAAEQYSAMRPDPTGVPTVVALGVFFQDVSNLSDTDQSMSSDLYVVARWKDSRLADPSRGEGSAQCILPKKEFWTPIIEPENLRARQQFYDELFLINASGVVTLARRSYLQTTYPLDFRDFPFDRQVWKFTLWPTLSRTDELVFHPLARFIGRNERLTIQGWKVGEPVGRVSSEKRPRRIGEYSRFDITIRMERDWAYYAWKLGLPLTLIVLMAYCVYFIPATAVAQQIGLSMTSMLTLIAYMLSLSGSLPKISYLTRADIFFIGSAILVFLGLLKAILTIIWMPQERLQRIGRMDLAGRWFYPFGMGLNVLYALVY